MAPRTRNAFATGTWGYGTLVGADAEQTKFILEELWDMDNTPTASLPLFLQRYPAVNFLSTQTTISGATTIEYKKNFKIAPTATTFPTTTTKTELSTDGENNFEAIYKYMLNNSVINLSNTQPLAYYITDVTFDLMTIVSFGSAAILMFDLIQRTISKKD